MVIVQYFLGIELSDWEEFNDDTVAELTNGRGRVYVAPVEIGKKVYKK